MKGLARVGAFVVIGAAVGALGGWGAYLAAPPVFRAETRIGLLGDDAWTPAQVTQRLQQAFTPAGLEDIIRQEHLYERERRTMTMADVVDKMRRDIEINPRMVNLETVRSFTVGFRHTVPRTAMRVTERLASLIVLVGIVDELRPSDWLAPPRPPTKVEGVRIQDGARLPVEPVSPRLLPHLALGALVGIGAGVAASVISSFRRGQGEPRRPSTSASRT